MITHCKRQKSSGQQGECYNSLSAKAEISLSNVRREVERLFKHCFGIPPPLQNLSKVGGRKIYAKLFSILFKQYHDFNNKDVQGRG